jgi:hypothetical protein
MQAYFYNIYRYYDVSMISPVYGKDKTIKFKHSIRKKTTDVNVNVATALHPSIIHVSESRKVNSVGCSKRSEVIRQFMMLFMI